MDTLVLILPLFLLSFANGSNDVSKGISTLVGSRITGYRSAIIWGTACTATGATVSAFFAIEMIKTFSGVINSDSIDIAFPIAVFTGASLWVIISSRTGIPVSTTHAITGALFGAGTLAVGFNNLEWQVLGKKIILPLAFSPLIALGLSWLFFPVIRRLYSLTGNYCICIEKKEEVFYTPVSKAMPGTISAIAQVKPIPQTSLIAAEKSACPDYLYSNTRVDLPDLFHWLSSGMTSFARGLNDTPKIVAIALTMTDVETGMHKTLFFLVASLAMGIGSTVSGLRVTRTLAERITPMNPQEGLVANITTSILVTIAARFGLPVSTTHVSSGSIIGIGLKCGMEKVRWRIVLEMVLAWIVTLPSSALIAFLAFWCLNKL